MVAFTTTLSPNYTRSRPIGAITSNALDVLHPAELAWVARCWARYEGNAEDCDYNVICELRTPITDTRVWVVDRNEELEPMLMLPSDY
jgi:hypothetical protein